jgi:hypothetical protein
MNKNRIVPKDHPADDPSKVYAMRLAIGVNDAPVARLLAAEILAGRDAYDAALKKDALVELSKSMKVKRKAKIKAANAPKRGGR